MTPREELNLLTIIAPGATGDDGQALETPWPKERIRPLGEFSDFVCHRLGQRNDEIREHALKPDALFGEAESLISGVSPDRIAGLLAPESGLARRVGLLDLVWVERSLDVAYDHSSEYRSKREHARVFRFARALAGIERRHPVLSWSDIAIYHPSNDPRSFLSPGPLRDQEILMYRIQGAIERAFRSIIETSRNGFHRDDLQRNADDLDHVIKAMIHLNKVRTIGQFYKLDPFLGPNGEYRGHGTGAFSIWTFVLGVLLAGNEHLRSRIADPVNWMAYDRDADPHVTQIADGTFVTLAEALAAQAGMMGDEKEEIAALVNVMRTKFTLFLHSHRGAMKRHSPGSFDDSAPSFPGMTNAQAMKAAINGMDLR
jgi:hypothetical protein